MRLMYASNFDFKEKKQASPSQGPVASWLVHSFPHQVVWVRALAEDIVLCY